MHQPRPANRRGIVPTASLAAVPEEILRARAYLARVAEPPAPALARFIAEVGPIAATARVRRGHTPAAVAAETAVAPSTAPTPTSPPPAPSARGSSYPRTPSGRPRRSRPRAPLARR